MKRLRSSGVLNFGYLLFGCWKNWSLQKKQIPSHIPAANESRQSAKEINHASLPMCFRFAIQRTFSQSCHCEELFNPYEIRLIKRARVFLHGSFRGSTDGNSSKADQFSSRWCVRKIRVLSWSVLKVAVRESEMSYCDERFSSGKNAQAQRDCTENFKRLKISHYT